ncbi:MAG: DUF4314 domain-containing protein [Ruminiclostridium sp.]|nr:DUF4314 domain-containing protein [Ruminiclostridium sp.]
MKIPTDEEIKAVKETYKKGMRVQLVRMNDEYGQAPPMGTKGTVEFVDGIGTVFVRWDNGGGLGVALGADEARIIDEKTE